MDFFVLFVLIVIAGVAVGLFLQHQTKIKSRWGLGALRPTCPRCGTGFPMIRKPTSSEEAMWGGWTCQNCGCKVDKYGNERAA
jgi:hypothetical protein